MTSPRGFASDNYSGVHPEVLERIAAANSGHAPAYGADAVSARAVECFREHFGATVEVFFTFNGTGANVTGLQALLTPYEHVICTTSAHVNTDECGAPERFLGSKLVDVPTTDGKLTPDLVAAVATGWGDPHHVQPRVVSITQSTELGTRYTADEVAALAAWAHERGMYLHMDGSRLSNAAAGLGVGLAATSGDAGVDVLSFGGTKNGLLGGEAVVFFRPELAAPYPYIRKQAMQLASKMRFTAAQFEALLSGDLWRRNAEQANAMALRLEAAVRDLPGVQVTRPVQANAVFAVIEPVATVELQAEHAFYVWDESTGEVRWMTSFDTEPGDVDAFAAAIRRACG
ncbi:MAG TPA: low specificity L-threonine aldolase [Acidimicrobiales bacterium]|nr:low specificity L-threonine aldolase [Acidimicrobiales bacterium]